MKKKSLKSAIDACYDKISSASSPTGKGTPGEQAVLAVCETIYQEFGGILYHSYSYKVDKDLPGNIKREDGKLYLENLGNTTEIDVLLVTPYRVFPIEVKTYRVTRNTVIKLSDDKIEGCTETHKSPVHQNEMHCRHLYSGLCKSLPNGETKYITPIVVFVDECKVEDCRSDWQKEYIKVTILNYLRNTILENNTPYEYKLDLQSVDNTLRDMMTSNEKYFKLRVKGD